MGGCGIQSEYITFFFPGQKAPPLPIWACQGICVLRGEPNMVESNRLKIPFRSPCIMWSWLGFFECYLCAKGERGLQSYRKAAIHKIAWHQQDMYHFPNDTLQKQIKWMHHIIIALTADLSLPYKGRQQLGDPEQRSRKVTDLLLQPLCTCT